MIRWAAAPDEVFDSMTQPEIARHGRDVEIALVS